MRAVDVKIQARAGICTATERDVCGAVTCKLRQRHGGALVKGVVVEVCGTDGVEVFLADHGLGATVLGGADVEDDDLRPKTAAHFGLVGRVGRPVTVAVQAVGLAEAVNEGEKGPRGAGFGVKTEYGLGGSSACAALFTR